MHALTYLIYMSTAASSKQNWSIRPSSNSTQKQCRRMLCSINPTSVSAGKSPLEKTSVRQSSVKIPHSKNE
ncbi:hypothetical protein J6590_088082 [Homalodisca vitripennis]|nr:hypothetical protein J6590_088082 [Homalodisca vitripennis]